MRIAGTVKWYSDVKGWGFITPHEKGKDVFVHRSALPADLGPLQEDDIVDFEIEPGPLGRMGAVRVELKRRPVHA